MRPGARATLALWGAAIVWDVLCPPEETISEAIERGLNDRRTEAFVTLALMVTVAHLMRSISPKYDLYAIGFRGLGRLVERKL